MKAILLILSVFISPAALALSPAQTQVAPVTCESLQEKARMDCEFAMCQDAILAGEPCIKDGDFLEGYMFCYSEALYYEIELYNKANPKAKLVCEDEE